MLFIAALVIAGSLQEPPTSSTVGPSYDPTSPSMTAATVITPRRQPDANGTLSVVVENDVFFAKDRHYSSGLNIGWTSGRDRVFGFVPKLTGLLFEEAGSHVHMGFALQHDIFTPRTILRVVDDEGARPYAGWLFGTMNLSQSGRSGFVLLQMSLGIVGPAALGPQMQNLVHRVIGSPRPVGWDSELHNEPGLVLAGTRGWTVLRFDAASFGLRFTPYATASVGNVFDYVGAGATLRFGQYQPDDIGVPRNQPAPAGTDAINATHFWGYYLFATAEGRAVLRNMFIDGNTFAESRSVAKEELVYDIQLGLAFVVHETRLSFTALRRSPEIEEQTSADWIGSLSLSKTL